MYLHILYYIIQLYISTFIFNFHCRICIADRIPQCFYMQETNMFSNRFIQVFYSLMMDQKGPKHVGVSGFYNVIVDLIQLHVFVAFKCSNKKETFLYFIYFLKKRTLNKNSWEFRRSHITFRITRFLNLLHLLIWKRNTCFRT